MSKKKPPESPVQGDLLPPEDSPISEKRAYATNPVVTEIPATCPRCGSTQSHVTKSTRFHNRPIRINGITYPARISRRRTCDLCACRFISNAPLTPDYEENPTA